MPSGSIPNFYSEDDIVIKPMPIYVTKISLRSILEQHGVEKLSDLARPNNTLERQQPKKHMS